MRGGVPVRFPAVRALGEGRRDFRRHGQGEIRRNLWGLGGTSCGPEVGVVSGVSGIMGRIAGVLCAGRGRDFRRRRKCGSSGCRVVEDASGPSRYPVSPRRPLAPCGWEATVAAHGPAGTGRRARRRRDW